MSVDKIQDLAEQLAGCKDHLAMVSNFIRTVDAFPGQFPRVEADQRRRRDLLSDDVERLRRELELARFKRKERIARFVNAETAADKARREAILIRIVGAVVATIVAILVASVARSGVKS